MTLFSGASTGAAEIPCNCRSWWLFALQIVFWEMDFSPSLNERGKMLAGEGSCWCVGARCWCHAVSHKHPLLSVGCGHICVWAQRVTEGPRRRCGDTRLCGKGPCATAGRCEGEAGLCLGCRGGVTADGATSPCVILNQICF